VSESSSPSYEELAAENVRLQEAIGQRDALIVRLEARLAELEARVAELEARLGQNSQNSSKPPSSDPPFKPSPKSLRGKSGRRPGRPDGQPGVTLSQVADPTFTVVHEPGPCDGCGADLSAARMVGMARRQVFDLPEQALEVTEHQVVSRRCGCGTVSCGVAPVFAAAPVQYGPRVRGTVVYLMHEQFLSRPRTAAAMADLFGVHLAEGVVTGAVAACARAVAPVNALIADRVAGAPVAHFDETGFRVEGACHWLHSASCADAVLLTVHRRRGREAIEHAGVLPRFAGIAVHDAWAPYDTYYLEAAVRLGVQATAPRASKLERKHNALFTRLRDRFADYTRWVGDLRLPFSNNSAEQTIRMPKLRIKVSGSMRSLAGAREFAAIRSYTATARRHGLNPFHVIIAAMSGQPWTPNFA